MSAPRIREVLYSDDPALAAVVDLYERSFAPDERDPISRLFDEADPATISSRSSPNAPHLLVIEEGDCVVGFVRFWVFSCARIAHIVHLAVEPSRWGDGHGPSLLRAAIARARLDMTYRGRELAGSVLEVERTELAETESEQALRMRRLRFFARMGARRISSTYTQPPVTKDGRPVPMNLLWIPESDDLSDEDIVVGLYRHAFGLDAAHAYVTDTLSGVG